MTTPTPLATDLRVPGTGAMGLITSCETREGLAKIKDPGAQLVIWERSFSLSFRDWINQVDPACLPDLRLLVEPSNLRDAMVPLLEDCGLMKDPMCELLLEDVNSLVHAFVEITDSPLVDVRLDRITGDACWKFHRDTVEARLLTTYRGSTTEWVPMSHADEAVQDQRDYDGPLERLGAFDVAVFKGSCAGPNDGIVHRSPPISGTGETRLLLCLNQPTVVSPEPWVKGWGSATPES